MRGGGGGRRLGFCNYNWGRGAPLRMALVSQRRPRFTSLACASTLPPTLSAHPPTPPPHPLQTASTTAWTNLAPSRQPPWSRSTAWRQRVRRVPRGPQRWRAAERMPTWLQGWVGVGVGGDRGVRRARVRLHMCVCARTPVHVCMPAGLLCHIPMQSIPSASLSHTHTHTRFSPSLFQIRFFRSMLEWGRDVTGEDALGVPTPPSPSFPSQQGSSTAGTAGFQLTVPPLAPPLPPQQQQQAEGAAGSEVMVLVWPEGKILRLPRGTTAGEAHRRFSPRVISPAAALLLLRAPSHRPLLLPLTPMCPAYVPLSQSATARRLQPMQCAPQQLVCARVWLRGCRERGTPALAAAGELQPGPRCSHAGDGPAG
jgi:hypothetical protein